VNRRDHAREVRNALTDPAALCAKLGLTDRARRQSRGLSICCPVHGERNPSCSVTTGSDGTIRVRCFGCDFTGDALTLIATRFGLSLSTDFREVLATGAELAGHHSLADEIRDGAARPERAPIAAPEPQPEPEYPDADEVRALWAGSVGVNTDANASSLFVSRKIDPDAITELDVARVIPPGLELPRFATYGARTWRETGHTLILRAWSANGALTSVRAWRVTEGTTPKRLPPARHKAAELVQANRLGWQMLAGRACPLRLYIVEGEPDFAVAATTFARAEAVLGIGSGSWTEDFARRVPRGTEVIVSTHADEAGDRYAEHVIETLGDRCPTWRWRMAA
jgi:hypothetical protein